jgi:hypothetical protein
MVKQPSNHNKQWTLAQVSQLAHLARQNTPTRVIALKMGRTPDAIRYRAGEERISLKPVNQSPYNRRPK